VDLYLKLGTKDGMVQGGCLEAGHVGWIELVSYQGLRAAKGSVYMGADNIKAAEAIMSLSLRGPPITTAIFEMSGYGWCEFRDATIPGASRVGSKVDFELAFSSLDWHTGSYSAGLIKSITAASTAAATTMLALSMLRRIAGK
jgi:hypothetical protein